MTTTPPRPPCTLPVGTVVLVTQPGLGPPFRGRIVGTDDFDTKYEIAREEPWRGQGRYGTGGWWAFPNEVQQIKGATR